ncbi:MAG: hypothetical protein J6T09_02075 [Bacteroidales bacterium]|nr:hypothetical protein [Bacteroidales bacterium]
MWQFPTLRPVYSAKVWKGLPCWSVMSEGSSFHTHPRKGSVEGQPPLRYI